MPTYFIAILGISLFVAIGSLFAYFFNPTTRSSNKLLNYVSIFCAAFVSNLVYTMNSIAVGLFVLGLCLSWFAIIVFVINKKK